MREVLDSQTVIANDKAEEKAAKIERAMALKSNSSIKSVNSEVSKSIEPKSKVKRPVIETITAESLLQKVTASNSIYSENSTKRKHFTFQINHFNKAAVYLMSKQNGTTLQETIEADTMVNIVKKAKALGLTEAIVKSLVENGTVK